MENKKVSTGGAWFMFGVVFLTAITFACGQFKVPPTMVSIIQDMGINVAQAGSLMSIVGIVAIPFSLFAGMLTVRFAPKTVALAAMTLCLLGNIVGYFSTSFSVLLVSRVIEGLGYGAQTAVLPTIVTQLFPEEKRGVPVAIYSAWTGLGMMFMFRVVANPVTATFGWSGNWVFCAILFVVMMAAMFFFVHPQALSDDEVKSNETFSDNVKGIVTELKNGQVWAMTVAFTMFGLGCTAYMSFAPTYCVQALGMSEAAANVDTALMSWGMIAGALLLSVVYSKVNRGIPAILVAASVLITVCYAVCFNLTAEWQVAPFCFIFGLLLAVIPPSVFALTPTVAKSPRTVGVALGIATAGDLLGGGFSSIIIGAIVDSTGSWGAAAPLMIVIGVLGVASAFVFWRNARKRNALAGEATVERDK